MNEERDEIITEKESAPLPEAEEKEDLINDELGKDVTPSEESNAPDYEEIMRSDLERLKEEFPELAETSSITEIKNPLRYAALRDLGLSPTEAYLAARGKHAVNDTRSHLSYSAPKVRSSYNMGMTHSELESARELFGDMTDSEIQKLYKRVTK